MESAIAKSFRLLEALSRAKGASRLSALAAEQGLQKSTVHRILGELRQLGYVEQEASTGLYRPTLRAWEMGTMVVADLPVKQVAAGALHRLHERSGETVSLVVRSGDDALYLDKLLSPRPVRFTTRVGSRVPLPVPASGRALLAASSDAEDVVRRAAREPALEGRIDVDHVLRRLGETRRRGYAVSSTRAGLVGIAASIVDRDDEPVAAVAVSAPAERMPRDRRAEVAELVLMTASSVGESLGRV